MIGREFFDKVTAHDELEWLGVIEGRSPSEDEALVCHTETGIKHSIAVASIIASSWQELEDVLTGKRESHVMIHLTRIVGYYSRVQNWNRSKVAELKDRQAGIYDVPAPQAPTVTAVTAVKVA